MASPASIIVNILTFVYVSATGCARELVIQELADVVCLVGWYIAEFAAIFMYNLDGISIVFVFGVSFYAAIEIHASEVFDSSAEVDSCNLGGVGVWVK